MQLGVQAVTGFFLEGGTPCSSVKRGVLSFLFHVQPQLYHMDRGDRTGETQMPNSYGDSAGSDLTTTKMSSQSQDDS